MNTGITNTFPRILISTQFRRMTTSPSSSADEKKVTETTETTETPETPQATTGQKLGGGFIIMFFIVWMLFGFAAFIMSIVCFGYSGSTSEKVVGLLLAFFLGPFYFIFYGVNKNYCRSIGANAIAVANGVMGGFKKRK